MSKPRKHRSHSVQQRVHLGVRSGIKIPKRFPRIERGSEFGIAAGGDDIVLSPISSEPTIGRAMSGSFGVRVCHGNLPHWHGAGTANMESLALPIGLRGALFSRMNVDALLIPMLIGTWIAFLLVLGMTAGDLVDDEIGPTFPSLFWFAEVVAAVAGWFWLKAKATRKPAPLPTCTVVSMEAFLGQAGVSYAKGNIDMDGAFNRGMDSIRDLTDTARHQESSTSAVLAEITDVDIDNLFTD